jgi:NAD dependent epimerase/dehydratase family enzyme
VALVDAAQIVAEALEREEIEGAVNVAAPEPVRNRDFARALGKVLRRPAFLSAPPFALRLVLGAMADEALLGSARVVPETLTTRGYRFALGDLDRAIRTALQR